MSARGELAKMGGEGASPKGHRGTDVSGHVGGWVLDEAGFRRVGSREAGERGSQRMPSTAGGLQPVKWLLQRPVPRTSSLAVASIGLAALSLIFLLTGEYVFPIGFLLPPAAVVYGVIALIRIRQSRGASWERWFAILGIVVGASMTLLLAPILWAVSEGGLGPCFDPMVCA